MSKEYPTRICKSCKICKVRITKGREPDKKIYRVDENGKRWSGATCPQCYVKQQAERNKLRKESKLLSNPSERKTYSHTCKWCEKEFTNKINAVGGRTSNYCGSSCRNKALRAKKNGFVKGQGICHKCGAKYFKDNKDLIHYQRICPNCAKEGEIKKLSALLHKRIKLQTKQRFKFDNLKISRCDTCDKYIFNRKSKYCSDECTPSKHIKVEYYCNTCGVLIEGRGMKYCSKDCTPRSASKNERRRLRKRMITQRRLNCVPWKEIHTIYKNKGDKQVDHIIPLNHPLVSGLHVTWNFQYLTQEENNLKSNNFDGTYNNESWKT